MNIQCSGGSRSFAKDGRAMKIRNTVADHLKLTMNNGEPSSKLILLELHEKFPKNSVLTILWQFGIWSKLERWKSSISGCLMSWPEIKKKKLSSWSVIFSYSMQQQETISWSDYDMQKKVKFRRQSVMTSSVVGPRSSKALPKAKHALKKGPGHCLVVCRSSDPQQLSGSQQTHCIWEVRSGNQWNSLKTAMPPANTD